MGKDMACSDSARGLILPAALFFKFGSWTGFSTALLSHIPFLSADEGEKSPSSGLFQLYASHVSK